MGMAGQSKAKLSKEAIYKILAILHQLISNLLSTFCTHYQGYYIEVNYLVIYSQSSALATKVII